MSSRSRIEELVAVWQQRLNLGDWDIRYDPELECDEGSWATIQQRTPEKVAVIALDKELPGEALALTIAHELVHLVVRGLDDMSGRLIAQINDDKARAIVSDEYEDVLETAVETIARALVPSAPRLTKGEGSRWLPWRLW